MLHQNQNKYFFIMMLCITYIAQTSLQPSTPDLNFDEECLHLGIHIEVSKTSNGLKAMEFSKHEMKDVIGCEHN